MRVTLDRWEEKIYYILPNSVYQASVYHLRALGIRGKILSTCFDILFINVVIPNKNIMLNAMKNSDESVKMNIFCRYIILKLWDSKSPIYNILTQS